MTLDPEHSYEGHTRLLYRHRPARLFTAYEKDEFVATDGEIFH